MKKSFCPAPRLYILHPQDWRLPGTGSAKPTTSTCAWSVEVATPRVGETIETRWDQRTDISHTHWPGLQIKGALPKMRRSRHLSSLILTSVLIALHIETSSLLKVPSTSFTT